MIVVRSSECAVEVVGSSAMVAMRGGFELEEKFSLNEEELGAVGEGLGVSEEFLLVLFKCSVKVSW